MISLELGVAGVVWTGRAEGHLSHRTPHDESCCGLDAVARRGSVRGGSWFSLAQMHGGDVVTVEERSVPQVQGDGAVTTELGRTLAVATADCAPIALASDEGVVGAVHGGWRSLRAGIIGNAAEAMQRLGATRIVAALGPCVHVGCYEFDGAALVELAELWGDGVVGHTTWGTPALDIEGAVTVECRRAQIEVAHVDSACTACDPAYFSYRGSGDADRQVMLVRRER